MRMFIEMPVPGVDKQDIAARAHREAAGTQKCFCLLWLLLVE